MALGFLANNIHCLMFCTEGYRFHCLIPAQSKLSDIVFFSPSLAGSRDSLLIERWAHDQKGCELKSWWERREKFLLQNELSVLTCILCVFHPMLLQWHVKDLGHSAKSAGGRLHLNTHTPLTQ